MSRSSGAMHVARIPSRYVSKSGEERRYESVLLRRTFRQEGKVRHETLANLSRLPGQVIALVDAALKGATLVDAQDAFETERSVPHGNAAAAHGIAKQLAARRLRAGGIAMFDLSSSRVEGKCCELAAFGHSRDGRRGRKQIEYGLLTCPQGRPVAVEVFAGNISDPISFKTAITRVRDDFGIGNLVMVGDRGMITNTRIADLRELPGMDWVTALRAPAIAALARDDGPLQMSLFDTQNFAEISHPDYPGERLICCRNPFLAADRARKRQALLAATEKDLEKIRASVSAGRLKGADKIGERVGKVIGKHKVGKHFLREISGTSFAYRRDEEKIPAEAASDGIYVIRTSVNEEILDSVGVITSCKNLKYAGRDFRITKADDLDLRPIYHYLDERVRGHVLICMPAAYLTWHLRQALAELTFTDQHIPAPGDPVAPARRSQDAKNKDAAKRNGDKLPVRK